MLYLSVSYGLFAVIFASLAKSELTWQQPSKPAQGLVSALKDNTCAFLGSARCLTQLSHFPAANRASQGGGRNILHCTSSALRSHQSMDFPLHHTRLCPSFGPREPTGVLSFGHGALGRSNRISWHSASARGAGDVRLSSLGFLCRFGVCLAAASHSQCHPGCVTQAVPRLALLSVAPRSSACIK